MVNILDITTQWEKQDDRTNKKYAGWLQINVEFGEEHCVKYGEYNRFINTLGGIIAKAGFYGQHHYTLGQDKPGARVIFHTKHRMSVERPSLIPSKEEMIEALGGEEKLKETFTRYAELADEYTKMYQHEEEVMRQANEVVRYCTGEACQEARKIVRYEQRMAALRAEYVAEVEAQVDLNLNKWKGEWLKEDGVITEAVKVGAERVMKHAIEAAKGIGQFRSGNTDPVRYDIITIDEWLAEKENADTTPQSS